MAYMPHFETETDTTPWQDCAWSSLSMLIDKWTRGHVVVHHRSLRTASGDSGGSASTDLARGVKNHPKTKGWTLPAQNANWTQVVALINKGYGMVLMGQYGAIKGYSKGHYTRWDQKFANKSYSGHAVYLQKDGPKGAHKAGYVWWMDPLGRGTYKGEWVPLNVVRSFAMALRKGNGLHYVNAVPEGGKAKPVATAASSQKAGDTMIVAGGLVLTSDYEIAVKKLTPFYEDANCTKVVTLAASDGTYEYYGTVPGNSISYAIEFESGKPFKDGLKRPIIGYIKRAAGKPVKKSVVASTVGFTKTEVDKMIAAAILADRKKATPAITVTYPA